MKDLKAKMADNKAARDEADNLRTKENNAYKDADASSCWLPCSQSLRCPHFRFLFPKYIFPKQFLL